MQMQMKRVLRGLGVLDSHTRCQRTGLASAWPRAPIACNIGHATHSRKRLGATAGFGAFCFSQLTSAHMSCSCHVELLFPSTTRPRHAAIHVLERFRNREANANQMRSRSLTTSASHIAGHINVCISLAGRRGASSTAGCGSPLSAERWGFLRSYSGLDSIYPAVF
jgi:hypothetical protein